MKKIIKAHMKGQMKSHGQMKIQEMAFMLLAVILLFSIAGMFFISIIYKDMVNSSNLAEKKEAIAIAVSLAGMPEFSCGDSLCIDSDKLLVMQNRNNYADFWPIASLAVAKISEDKEKIECSEKNYPNCNYFSVYKNDQGGSSVEVTETFVGLCRKERENGYVYRKCELARVLVGFEKETEA